VVECGLGATTAGDASLQAAATSFVGVFVGVKKAINDGLPLQDQIVSTTPSAGDMALIVDDPDATFIAITTPQATGGAVAPIVGQTYGFGEAVNSAASVNTAGKHSKLSVSVAAALANGPVRVLEVINTYNDDTNTWYEVKVSWGAGHQLLSTASLA